MQYLSPHDFEMNYPCLFMLDYGADGKIYKTTHDCIVKHMDTSFITELFCNQELIHEHILQPVAWTWYKLAMPKAMDIQVAIQKKLITPELVVKQMYKACGYLKHKGLCHTDLHVGNIVFHQGKAKIIDFGQISFLDRPVLDYGFTSMYFALHGDTLGTLFVKEQREFDLIRSKDVSLIVSSYKKRVLFYERLLHHKK